MVSASNNNYLVTALMDNTRTSDYECRTYNSTDAGNTWTDRGFLSLPSGTNTSNDPVVASTTDSKFFIACFARDSTDGKPSYILYWVSTDNGNSWSSPNIAKKTADGTETDKPWIVADVNDPNSSSRNNVYACWTDKIAVG